MIVVAVAILVTATTVAAVRLSANEPGPGPMHVPRAHGWSYTFPQDVTFTDGLEVLKIKGAESATITSVSFVGDPELTLVGAFVAPPPRRQMAVQVIPEWPPRAQSVFDAATLLPAEGARIRPNAESSQGWELLLGVQVTEPGIFKRDSVEITYEVNGHEFSASFPAQLTVCTGVEYEVDGRCPFDSGEATT